MKRFEVSPVALSDIDQIVGYVMLDSESAAAQVFEELEAAFELIATNPRIGRLRGGAARVELRTWVVYSYIIVYRPDLDPLHIVRVLHGAQNIDRLLRTLEVKSGTKAQARGSKPRRRK